MLLFFLDFCKNHSHKGFVQVTEFSDVWVDGGAYAIATQTIKNWWLDIPVFKSPWLHCYLEFLCKLHPPAMHPLLLLSPFSHFLFFLLSHPKFMFISYEKQFSYICVIFQSFPSEHLLPWNWHIWVFSLKRTVPFLGETFMSTNLSPYPSCTNVISVNPIAYEVGLLYPFYTWANWGIWSPQLALEELGFKRSSSKPKSGVLPITQGCC